MTKFLTFTLILGAVLGAFGSRFYSSTLAPSITAQAKPVKYSETVTGRGYFQNNGLITVVLSDGRIVAPLNFKTVPSGWEAQINDDIWVKGGAQ